MLTREEFIGRAADAIMRHQGDYPETATAEVLVEAVESAKAALEAVGAFNLYRVCCVYAADGGRELEHDSGYVDHCTHPACVAVRKAEGR